MVSLTTYHIIILVCECVCVTSSEFVLYLFTLCVCGYIVSVVGSIVLISHMIPTPTSYNRIQIATAAYINPL